MFFLNIDFLDLSKHEDDFFFSLEERNIFRNTFKMVGRDCIKDQAMIYHNVINITNSKLYINKLKL